MNVDPEFDGAGQLLVVSCPCVGEVVRLKSGNLGWNFVSRHIEWTSGWRLRFECSITQIGPDYGLPKPKDGQTLFRLDHEWKGRLGEVRIDNRNITVTVRVPDCLDPPKKSFNAGFAIPVLESIYHCKVQLQTRAAIPSDGSYLHRYWATPDTVGGIEVRLPGEKVVATIPDSEAGRGNQERFWAAMNQRKGEFTTSGKVDGVKYLRVRQEIELSKPMNVASNPIGEPSGE